MLAATALMGVTFGALSCGSSPTFESPGAEGGVDVVVQEEASADSPLHGPIAANGQMCTLQGGSLALEMQGVHAREGECLINYDGAVLATASGDATPEAAIRGAGFGRYQLTQEPATTESVELLHYREWDGPLLVGAYSVNVMQDGTFIVHGVVASTPL